LAGVAAPPIPGRTESEYAITVPSSGSRRGLQSVSRRVHVGSGESEEAVA